MRPKRTSMGKRASLRPRAVIAQQLETVADITPVRRFDKRKLLDIAELQAQHLQNHRGQAGAQDFRFGEFRALPVILLAVQADADAGSDAAAASRALVGGGLRHGFDRQALHLGAVTVTADTRDAGVDHIMHARHGDGGFSDIGGEHDTPPAMRLRRREPPV
jgi:hypothetical protein